MNNCPMKRYFEARLDHRIRAERPIPGTAHVRRYIAEILYVSAASVTVNLVSQDFTRSGFRLAGDPDQRHGDLTIDLTALTGLEDFWAALLAQI